MNRCKWFEPLRCCTGRESQKIVHWENEITRGETHMYQFLSRKNAIFQSQSKNWSVKMFALGWKKRLLPAESEISTYVFLLAYFHFLSVLLSSEGNKEGNAVNHSRLDDFEHTLFFLYNSLRRSELEIKHRHNSLKPACVHLLSWFRKKKNSLNLRISILKHRKKFRNI